MILAIVMNFLAKWVPSFSRYRIIMSILKIYKYSHQKERKKQFWVEFTVSNGLTHLNKELKV